MTGVAELKPHTQYYAIDGSDIEEPEAQEFTPEQLKKFNWEGARVLVGGFMIHLILGTFYLWGGVVQYISSYLRFHDDSTNLGTAKAVFPFMALIMACTMSFGSKLSARFGPKPTAFVTMLVYALVVFSVSFISNFWAFCILYSVLLGTCTGILYMIPVSCGMRYFPDRKGLVSGVIISGYGFGTLVFNQVAFALINPDNIKPTIKVTADDTTYMYYDHNVADNVPFALKILALIYCIVGVIGIALLNYPKHTPHDAAAAKEPAFGETNVQAQSQDCPSIMSGLKIPQFYILFAVVFLSSWYGMYIASDYKLYGGQHSLDDKFLTMAGSVGSAFNGCIRPIAGITMDKIGFKKVIALDMAIQAAIVVTFELVASNKAAFFIWYLISMATEGSLFAIMPAVSSKIWGRKMGPAIYGYVFFAFATATISGFFIGRQIHNYPTMWWIGFALSVAAIFAVVPLKETHDWSKFEEKTDSSVLY